ncbi:hypothetical protein [Aquitalea pelogenes]|uniref:hypothetical protein n=1 Tax=Aquitalea pelogenes TaxID=1293573 RepID=UPI0035B39588
MNQRINESDLQQLAELAGIEISYTSNPDGKARRFHLADGKAIKGSGKTGDYLRRVIVNKLIKNTIH